MPTRRYGSIVSVIAILTGFAAIASAQGTVVATPSQLNLDNTTGSQVSRTVTLTTTSTTPISFTTGATPSSWLMVSPTSGSVVAGTPLVMTLTANAAGLDVPSTTNVFVNINSGGQTIVQIPVYFNVEVVTGLTASPSGIGWSYAIGGASPPQQPVTLYTSANTFTATETSTGDWLQLLAPNQGPLTTPQSAIYSFPTSEGLILVFNPQANGFLTPGMSYSGTVMITDSAGNTGFLTVTLNVLNSSGAFSLSQGSVTLTSSNGASAMTTLQLAATNATPFTGTATVNTPPGGAWLTVTPSGTAPAPVTITANPAGLSTGTYLGAVTFASGGLSAVVQVSFIVAQPAVTGGNVVSDHASLTFGYTIGGTQPTTETITISDQSGSANIPFTVSTSTPAGATNWLSAVVAGGGTQGVTGTSSAQVIVTANPQGLAPADYSGATVNIAPVGGNVVGIPVTFQVTGQSTVTASPLQLSFSYQTGTAAPQPQTVQVTGTAPSLPFTVATATQSGGNWLSASASTGITGSNTGTAFPLNISVAPGQLAPGSYQGSMTVAGAGTASGTTTIQIFLTVTSVLPSITSVVNAASYLAGPISPGELVTIYGSNLGPTPAVGTTLTAAGTVSTNIGNVQVLFNGTPAPLLYVSPSQINCVAPYEFAQASTSPYVQVKYQGQSSNVYNVQQGATAPAIFTVAAGTGQGAILNSDNSVNGSTAGTTAAAKGSTVQLYMTGEGVLSPPQATGAVTCSAGCATTAQIPMPAAKVAVLVNNQPATFTFAGDAPGFVSGVLQVDITIPANAPSGAVPITVTVGGVSSQTGVTVTVQ